MSPAEAWRLMTLWASVQRFASLKDWNNGTARRSSTSAIEVTSDGGPEPADALAPTVKGRSGSERAGSRSGSVTVTMGRSYHGVRPVRNRFCYVRGLKGAA